jgi:hypothetical protein
MNADPLFDAVVAKAQWMAAKHWLGVWAGAGFVARLEGEQIMMPKKWAEKFPDGPLVLGMVRAEAVMILQKVDANRDPRLAVAYYRPEFERHLGNRIADTYRRLDKTRQVKKSAETDGKYPADPDTVAHCLKLIPVLEAEIKALRADMAALREKICSAKSHPPV